MKKVISAILVLIILLVICAGCSKPATDGERIITTAKVRYLDGSTETLEITHFSAASQSGLIHIFLTDGSEMYFGVNNVIIVKETEEKYTH